MSTFTHYPRNELKESGLKFNDYLLQPQYEITIITKLIELFNN